MVLALDTALGRFVNVFFWFFSIIYILPVTIKILLFILRKSKKQLKPS
jgi:hypothetical protein